MQMNLFNLLHPICSTQFAPPRRFARESNIPPGKVPPIRGKMVHFPGKNGENGGKINISSGKVPGICRNTVHFQKRLSYFIPGKSASDSWKTGALSRPKGKLSRCYRNRKCRPQDIYNLWPATVFPAVGHNNSTHKYLITNYLTSRCGRCYKNTRGLKGCTA